MKVKVEVQSGMPDGFFAFYNPKGGVGKRYREGEKFIIDCEEHFSVNYMKLNEKPTKRFLELFEVDKNGSVSKI